MSASSNQRGNKAASSQTVAVYLWCSFQKLSWVYISAEIVARDGSRKGVGADMGGGEEEGPVTGGLKAA